MHQLILRIAIFFCATIICFNHRFQNHLLRILTDSSDHIDQLPTDLQQFQPNEHCYICHFQASPQNSTANSSESDLVMGISTHEDPILRLVRSLRTVRCKATFVVFVDPISANALSDPIYKNCGIWPIIPSNFTFSLITIELTRYHMYHRFLITHKTLFKRILLADITDTIFQSDPFTHNFGLDHFYISQEPLLIFQDQVYNSKWLLLLHPQSYFDHHFKNKYILCVGLIAGGFSQIFTFLTLYIHDLSTFNITFGGMDQAVGMGVFYNESFCGGYVPTCIFSPADTGVFSSAAFLYIELNDRVLLPGKVMFNNSGIYPSVLHHINRHHLLDATATRMCQKTKVPYSPRPH